MENRVKELERIIDSLQKRHRLLLDVISVQLGDGKQITLEEAIALVRSVGIIEFEKQHSDQTKKQS